MIANIEFLFSDDILKDYQLNREPLTNLESLSKINFFVGANNSGKSRLLRNLLIKLSAYRNIPDGRRTFDYNGTNSVSLVKCERAKVFLGIEKYFNDLRAFTNGYRVKLDDMLPKVECLDESSLWSFFSDLTTKVSRSANLNNPEQNLSKIEEFINTLMPIPFNTKINTTYIPVNRSIKKFVMPQKIVENNEPKIYDLKDYEIINTNILKQRIFWDYFASGKKQMKSDFMTFVKSEESFESLYPVKDIFSGEELYDLVKALRNSGEKKRVILIDYQKFLSENFFKGEKIEINAIQTGHFEDIHIKIGDEEEFPIHELGEGIKSIIVLTFPLFYKRNDGPHVIFYEEPELNLHPGLERLFINTLLKFNNVQAFICTHSNHLLDVYFDKPEDVSIFSFEKRKDKDRIVFNLDNLSSPQTSLLDILEIRNSSIFLSNCCIWVEGVSDRIYIKKFIELYISSHENLGLNLHEDLHFSFLEFSGNNIVHYSFDEKNDDRDLISANKITNRIFLIHDRDNGKNNRHQHLKKELGDNYYCLDVLEIENLIGPDILTKTLIDFKKNKSAPIEFNELDHKNYYNTPFSKYVSDLIRSGDFKKIFSSSNNEQATNKLYNKAEFARKVVSNINAYGDLSDPAKKLTKEIVDFILSHNQS